MSDLTMQPMTEKTALALIDAIERNTAALQAIQQLTEVIKGGSPMQQPATITKRQVDPDYLPGGHEWKKSLSVEELIAWNKEQAAKRRRKIKVKQS